MDTRLFEIIKQRRSTRSFSERMPETESIQRIVASAVYAPYGGATGIPLDEVRKIYIFRRNTPAMDNFKFILMDQIGRNSRKLNRVIKFLPILKNKFGAFAQRLHKFSKNGIPGVEQAAYIIVIAEKKGFPPIEKQSLAHAMQNMWLMATSEELGFQLISAIGTLADNSAFINLLELEKGKYALDGCAVGVPLQSLNQRRDKDIEKYIRWM